MKYIIRTLIVILVIGLVGGGLYLLLNNSSSALSINGQAPDGEFSLGSDSNQQLRQNHGQFPGGDGFERGEAGEGSARGVSDLGIVLLKLTGITVVIVFIQWILRLIKRRKPTTNTAS